MSFIVALSITYRLDLPMWAVDTSGAQVAPCGDSLMRVGAFGGEGVWHAAALRNGVDLVSRRVQLFGVLGSWLPGLEHSKGCVGQWDVPKADATSFRSQV